MTNRRVQRLSAFTTDPAGGNPAGVVLDAEGMSEEEMLSVAADVGYSETAFLDSLGGSGDRRYRVRYFSPRAEVDFCGHATIAAAVALAERDGAGRVELVTNAGPVDVETWRDQGHPWARLTSAPARCADLTERDLTELLRVLRLTVADLDVDRPPRLAYAGNWHPIIPLASRAGLCNLDYDYDAADVLMAARRWTTLQIVWFEDDHTVHSRNAFPPGGVREDPATGAAAAALGAYLRDLELVPRPATVTIHQGHDMGRPSLLLVDIPANGASVQVTGTAVVLDEHAATPSVADVVERVRQRSGARATGADIDRVVRDDRARH